MFGKLTDFDNVWQCFRWEGMEKPTINQQNNTIDANAVIDDRPHRWDDFSWAQLFSNSSSILLFNGICVTFLWQSVVSERVRESESLLPILFSWDQLRDCIRLTQVAMATVSARVTQSTKIFFWDCPQVITDPNKHFFGSYHFYVNYFIQTLLIHVNNQFIKTFI